MTASVDCLQDGSMPLERAIDPTFDQRAISRSAGRQAAGVAQSVLVVPAAVIIAMVATSSVGQSWITRARSE